MTKENVEKILGFDGTLSQKLDGFDYRPQGTRTNIRNKLGYSGTVLFAQHHESHAASAFFPSPFQEAAILTMDGVGEWATTSIASGKDNKIELLQELHFPHSLGLLYSAFTYYLGNLQSKQKGCKKFLTQVVFSIGNSKNIFFSGLLQYIFFQNGNITINFDNPILIGNFICFTLFNLLL